MPVEPRNDPTGRVLGMRFWMSEADELIGLLDRRGGLMIAPSAPSLCAAADDSHLLQVHHDADHAVMDSGYLALLLRMRRLLRLDGYSGEIRRISGLQIMELLLAREKAAGVPFRNRRILWVVPSEQEKRRITILLQTACFNEHLQDFYIAPEYPASGSIRDGALELRVGKGNPDWIILCISGGKQEKLGWSLREQMLSEHRKRKPAAIVCTGAAISFLSGGQSRIPRWADRLYLGWLFRIASSPRGFLIRYASAFRLPLILHRLEQPSLPGAQS